MEDYECETQFYTQDVYANKNNNFRKGAENSTDLHNYFMTQFNMELDNKSKKKNAAKEFDDFQYGNEESFNFEVGDSWGSNNVPVDTGLEVIDAVLENNNVDEKHITEVLLDLDSIGSDGKTVKEMYDGRTSFNESNDYIDDESLIDELCREESDCRLTPDVFNDYYAGSPNSKKESLPSMETAFSKFYNYNNPAEASQTTVTAAQPPVIHNLDCYSYPNSYLQNLENTNKYILPDTPTSCTEFTYDKSERKVSVSESIDSDLQSSCYYDGNSETFEEDDLFVNLDDFGLRFENDDEVIEVEPPTRQYNRGIEREKHQGERCCLWEMCNDKYPNQSTLVEHIERVHVNSYKGDEFSCLWQNCARSRRPFNARYKLLIHMRVHSGHKPNRCHHPGCGKAFSRLENLKIHVRSHTGERPYACPAPHCRKAFSNSSDRAKHQRTHFNARPYACGAAGCGKRYTDPSSLRKHVKSHPHETSVPRTSLPPVRPFKRDHEQTVPSSPAKLATLRCIRDKLTIPKLIRL